MQAAASGAPGRLVHERAAGDVDLGGGYGASEIGGHEGGDVAHVGQRRRPTELGFLLDTRRDGVLIGEAIGDAFRYAPGLQGDDADAMRAELDRPLAAQPLDYCCPKNLGTCPKNM